MRVKTLKQYLLAGTLGLAAPVLLAQDDIRDPYYIGLGIGSSFLKPATNSAALELSQDRDLAYRVFGGYQFTDNWAAEGFWAEMGQAEISPVGGGSVAGIVEYQAYGLGGLFQYPLSESFDVFATAGLGRLRNRFQMIDAERVEDNFVYAGGGVMWTFARTWDLRAEYDYYDTDAQMLSFNLVKRFGGATPRRIAQLEQQVAEQEQQLTAISMTEKPAAATQQNCADFSIELKGVVFDKRSVELNKQSKQALDALAEKLKQLPQDIRFEIRAHTDNVGTELYNYTLSLTRARNVRDYLASKGIPLSRIDAQGYGEWRPLQSNDTEAGRRANRRAELVLIGTEKYSNRPECSEK